MGYSRLEELRKLVLIRHGKALNESASDFLRPLAPEGRRRINDLAKSLVENQIELDLVICSPSKRTRETLEELEHFMSVKKTLYEENIYTANQPKDLIDAVFKCCKVEKVSLADFAGAGSIAVVGHNPTISLLVESLSGASCHMDPGNCWALTINAPTWEEALISDGLWDAKIIHSH